MKKLLAALLVTISMGLAVFAEPVQGLSNEAKLEYNRGVDLYKLGQYDRSMAAFRRAIELDANYIDAYYNLGSILEYLHQDDAALAVFKQIIVRNPNDYESLYKAALLSNKLGQIDKAKSYLSLIPPSSSIYSQAQTLAASMNTDMQTIKANEQMSAEQTSLTKFEQTNGMYNNIPSPTGITADTFGNLYVASFSDNLIYKVTPDGRQIVFVKDSKINGPIALVSDLTGNIYVSNYNNNNLLKITPAGNITVQIANIDKPYGMSITSGMLFVSSQGTNSVLRYKL